MIAAGLVYDNFIIAIGATIGAGELLITLSWPRFALHAICTPFTMIAIWQIADAADFRWARMLIFIKRSAVAGCSNHSAINNQAILVSFFQLIASRASLVSCHRHTQQSEQISAAPFLWSFDMNRPEKRIREQSSQPPDFDFSRRGCAKNSEL